MQISDILKTNERGIAFEFFPPKTAQGKQALLETVGILKRYKPLYVSMTYGAGGVTQEYTKDAVSLLLKEQTLEVMPHLTCVGANAGAIQGLLDDYRKQGIDNIMALRGDPPKECRDFDFNKQEFSCARDLVRVLKAAGHFCIGVAVYPQGHIETDTLEQDMEYTKLKIDAGADFAVTQMFFDNTYYYALLERMHKKKITIPVLPGILPLTDVTKVKQFASLCRATIPRSIEERMERYRGNPADMEKEGIDVTIELCRDLVKNGVNQFHFFTLNKPKVITAILDAIR